MKAGEKALLGVAVAAPLVFIGYRVIKAEPKVEVVGHLGSQWQYWQEGMTDWQPLGTGLAAGIPVYLSVDGVNDGERAVRLHIDLVVTGSDIEDTKLPAYANQDKKAEPGGGWPVGFGPVTLEVGHYALEASLKINGRQVDTESMEFLVS